jgi:hypothetical protein
MKIYSLIILFALMGCHRLRPEYISLKDGLVFDKKSGDVFEVKADRSPPFKYVGNLEEFREEIKK